MPDDLRRVLVGTACFAFGLVVGCIVTIALLIRARRKFPSASSEASSHG
jgi:hypothetical protein